MMSVEQAKAVAKLWGKEAGFSLGWEEDYSEPLEALLVLLGEVERLEEKGSPGL